MANKTSVYPDDEDGHALCNIALSGSDMSRQIGGVTDGWGTFGNVDGAP